MEQASEVTRRIQEWKELYRQLLQISQEQRALTDGDASGEFDFERLGDLHRRWKEAQSSVMTAESALKASVGTDRFNSLFEEHALPVIRDIQQNIRESTDWIKQAMAKAGGSIRSVRDHRHARLAYGDADRGLSTSMFFDEKK